MVVTIGTSALRALYTSGSDGFAAAPRPRTTQENHVGMANNDSCNAARRPARRRWLAWAALCTLLGSASMASGAEPPPELKPPAKPTAMPAFALPTTSGSKLDSAALKGRVLVIRFWASW